MNDSDITDVSGCFHCGLPVPAGGRVDFVIHGKTESFCCQACAQVCQIINDAGLERFYEYAPQERSWETPVDAPEDVEIFDHFEVQQDFVSQRPDGSLQAQLLIEGIHCPACVWLIEHTLKKMDGILGAEVNYTKHRLKLNWDPERLKLSDIIRRIGHIGYRALPFEEDEAFLRAKKERQDLMFRMVFAGFVVANVMTAAVCLYAGDFLGIADRWSSLFKWYSLAFTIATVSYSARNFFTSAFHALKTGYLNMDVPITLGITVSFTASAWATVTGEGHVYYDSISMFIFLILIGRYLEFAARESASSSTQHLLALLPRSARVLDDSGKGEKLLPLRLVKSGDILRIKPGDRVPVDGVVISGESRIDESMLSGESLPVHKGAGSKVVGGTMNMNGVLTIEATDVGHRSVLSQIVEMIESAQNSRVRVQSIADRIVPYFVAVILALALITFAFWIWQGDRSMAIMAAVSVLIITCPCALGLATPMAVAVGAGLGGKLGTLIKKGDALEQLTSVNHIVFDKTGTLTSGHIQIHRATCLEGEQALLFAQVLALESQSEHPLAQALTSYLLDEGYHTSGYSLEAFENIPGRGIEGRVVKGNEKTGLRIGSLGWVEHFGLSIAPDIQQQMDEQESLGLTVVVIFTENELLGWFALGDELRPEAKDVVRQLQQQGIEVSILSGDRRAVVEAIAAQLTSQQQTPLHLMAEVLPGDKTERIKALQDQGMKVCMIGDGINDAPALTQANVGMAVAHATDISAHAADVVLLGGLEKVRTAIELSAQTMRTIKQNLGISLGYNVMVIPLAVAGLVYPLLAAIAMPASSLLVIFNALRIRSKMKRFEIKLQQEI
ncbi:MAG: heavy metal translocating P-type ATPase [Mariprofundaceae bacterium]|nr:heavy metal translocating P-type ATPase [Mariprofundaceae bacterium]